MLTERLYKSDNTTYIFSSSFFLTKQKLAEKITNGDTGTVVESTTGKKKQNILT